MNAKKILSTIASKAPATAEEIALALGCTPGQFLQAYHNLPDMWWSCEAVPGPSGMLYRARPVIDAHKRMAREVKEFINQGITPTGPKGYIA